MNTWRGMGGNIKVDRDNGMGVKKWLLTVFFVLVVLHFQIMIIPYF